MSDARLFPKHGAKVVDLGEARLVARAREGDRAAFDALVEAHLPQVWRVVWRIVRNDADAEDVVQDAFLTAWKAIPNFRGEASVATWLHRIATTRALNHLERAHVRRAGQTTPIDEDPDGEGLPVPDSRPSPLAALEAAELARRLKRCLEELPAAWRAILALREGESLAYEEIARALDLALGTVRSRIARARTALRDCVQGAAA